MMVAHGSRGTKETVACLVCVFQVICEEPVVRLR